MGCDTKSNLFECNPSSPSATLLYILLYVTTKPSCTQNTVMYVTTIKSLFKPKGEKNINIGKHDRCTIPIYESFECTCKLQCTRGIYVFIYLSISEAFEQEHRVIILNRASFCNNDLGQDKF